MHSIFSLACRNVLYISAWGLPRKIYNDPVYVGISIIIYDNFNETSASHGKIQRGWGKKAQTSFWLWRGRIICLYTNNWIFLRCSSQSFASSLPGCTFKPNNIVETNILVSNHAYEPTRILQFRFRAMHLNLAPFIQYLSVSIRPRLLFLSS